MTFFRSVASAALILLFGSLAQSQDSPKTGGIDSPAPAFDLEDAYGRQYASAGMRDNYVFLLFGPRKQAEAKRRWAQSVLDAFPDRNDTQVYMVADMRDVPFFITRDFVKGRIRKENFPVPLLLDWDQVAHGSFGIQPKGIEIVVIDPAGRVLLRRKTEGFAAAEAGAFLKEFMSAVGRGPAKGGAKP